MLKRISIWALLVAMLTGGFAAVFYAYGQHREKQELEGYRQVFEEAGELLESSQPGQALALMEAHFKPGLADTLQRQWPERMVEAALASRNYSHLEHFVAQYPQTLLTQESVALWWARAQMHRRFWAKAQSLFEHWPEAERKFPHRWHLLKADHSILEGDRAAAEDILHSWQGEGHDEVNRQLRLALLADSNAEAVREALASAYAVMPTSADLRLTAAQFFERSGDLTQARREYIAAYLLAPDNPFPGHQLAEFYLRLRALPQAVTTWREIYERTKDPRAWWQVWFWERVTLPRGEALAPAPGNWWGNLPGLMSQTSEAAFLSEGFLGNETPPILMGEAGFYWLLALEHLRLQDEVQALTVLETMPDRALAGSNDLHRLLTALLDWRVHGSWPRALVLDGGRLNHRFFRFLENYRPANLTEADDPQTALEQFLRSSEAPGVLLLAHGWLAAADRLLPEGLGGIDIAQTEELDWLPFAYCKMKSRLSGPGAAIAAAADFPGDSAVQGFLAEMLLADGQVEAGMELLAEVADAPGAAGYRASYLQGLSFLDERKFEALDALLSERADLAQSVAGRELLARSARMQGDSARALALYAALGDESIEGCLYRYQAALADSDTQQARRMLETLLRIAPNEPTFHQWLRDLEKDNG